MADPRQVEFMFRDITNDTPGRSTNTLHAGRGESPIFKDEVLANFTINSSDALSAAWNAWEAACKFQDEEKMNYYMNLIRIFSEINLKLVKIKKL